MARLSAFTYALPCARRGIKYFPSGFREGLFLQVEQADGRFGIGEYAPLSGIHRHSIGDVLGMVQALKTDRLDEVFSIEPGLTSLKLTEKFSRWPYPLSFLLSMAHFHQALVSRSATSDKRRAIRMSALIDATASNEAIALAQGFLAQGFDCLKIKVGGLPINDEVTKIKTIAAIAGAAVNLRLDANQRLSLADARTLLQGLRRVKLEYFEEPLADMTHAQDLCEESGVNIAVDESFLPPFDVALLVKAGIKFLVIKPSRFNSVYQVIELAADAKRQGIAPIFSPCFESEFSAAMAGLMIDELGLLEYAHGIVTEGFFKHGVSTEPLRGFRGQLLLDSAISMSSRDFLSCSPSIKRIF